MVSEGIIIDAPSAAPEEKLLVAMLLSAAGAFLDAYAWIQLGGVFANAQTGNVVLLGLFAALGQWKHALAHIPPLVAFCFGVFIAQSLRLHAVWGGEHRAPALSIVIEVALLAAVAALPPGFPDFPVVVGIAFVAALQNSSFARVEGFGYNSVMTTGNLRRMAESLFAGVAGRRDPVALRQARIFATLCVTFCLGAALGAFCTARVHQAALLVPIGMLLLVLVLAREGKK